MRLGERKMKLQLRSVKKKNLVFKLFYGLKAGHKI